MPVYALDGVAPELPPDGDCWIAPDAVVIGRVKIGRGASVWFGAVLRGDTETIEICDGANVQDGAVLHTDPGFSLVVGRGVTIGHRAIVHGCRIGDHALVGMGATLLNGSQLGAGSLLGAGALLTEGKAIPEGVLAVGAPARVARELSQEEIEDLRRPGAHYRENGRRFARGLVQIG